MIPNWAKEILYERMTLFKAHEIVKYHNIGGDAMHEDTHPFRKKISMYAIDDLTIQMISDHLRKKFKGDELVFKIIDHNGNVKEIKQCFDTQLRIR